MSALKDLRAEQQKQLDVKQQEWAQKKWVWLIDAKEGCIAAHILKETDKELTIKLNTGNEQTVSKDDTEAMNPPKFDKIEDMAELTHLNESSVLHNLRERYYANMIYTYSGLFLVVINPWKRLPIYTDEIVTMYKGKKRKEMPPHIFAVCDEAYRDMLQNKDNQSLLITGESGAGKTENTKKVIQYLTAVAGTSGNATQNKLEQQILQTNPLLEAFGNAKTVRNNNSSRFGKFIRIEFGSDGKIVGCNIDNYLLEKSRVVRHAKSERSFHIFYQLLESATPQQKEDMFLDQPRHYKYLEGETTIEGVDNVREFADTMAAIKTIGFNETEINNIFRVISGVLLFGNLEFTQSKRDEAANIKDTSVCDKIAHVHGIKSADFQKALIRPRVRAGREVVTQMVNAEKAVYNCEALSKVIYERMFKWIVTKINSALEVHGRAATFIGCLDIAGFEIFELNSFEQLCINLTNEKLQQFFNHHMFILEQEEYIKEGIEWKFVDFGLDLQPTIDLIEKPMGIMSILDEECLFPKATDQSFIEKLHAQHEGKTSQYSKLRLNPTMFVISHYAGKVEYDTNNWLDKNKDPINDNVANLFRKSTNELIAKLFEDAVDPDEVTERRGKANTFITVSQRHRQQLTSLLNTLYQTKPHFVRCIIPNEVKKPGIIEAPLVLDQLRCNGVLEGIRIVRMGFPSRIPFAEFRQRYEILASGVIPKGFMDSKVASEKLISALQIKKEEYRMGISKVFFKTGVIAALEERRDEKIGQLLTGFQAMARGYIARKAYRRAHGKSDAILVIQRNAKVFIDLYQWSWWKLYRQVKPLLGIYREEQAQQKLKDRIAELEELLKKEQEARQSIEGLKNQLEKERDELMLELNAEKESLEQTLKRLDQLEDAKSKLKAELNELEKSLEEADTENAKLEANSKKLLAEIKGLQAKLEDNTEILKAVEETKQQNQEELEKLKKVYDMEKGKLTDELEGERKRREQLVTENNTKIAELQGQVNRLKTESKQSSTAKDELEAELQESERKRLDAEKAKRNIESQLADLQKELNAKSSDATRLSDQHRDLQAKISALQTRLDETEAAKASVSQLKANLEEEVGDLRDQLTEANKSKVEAARANLALEAELNELSEKLVGEEKKRKEIEVKATALEREAADAITAAARAKEEADNSLMEALKAERLKVAQLEEKLRFETSRRIQSEERLQNEIANNKGDAEKLRQIRETLRK